MSHLTLHTIAAQLNPVYWVAPAGALAALFMAFMFFRSVMSRSEGEPNMVNIAQAVRDGAMAYLTRQYRVVAVVFVALVIFLAIMWQLKLQDGWALIGVPIAGLFSGLCGWFGMKTATYASARTTFAAKTSLNDALTVAFRSGAVMGMVVVGFALLDASVWFYLFNQVFDLEIQKLTTVMLSFAMGASTQALFARVGGGIYTKAADVGADLVGKVEAGIPEDDARNPATIADNVGDNVGDVAGMGADLYESYYGSILATMALGAAGAFTLGLPNADATKLALGLAVAPLALAGIGIFCSIIGVFTVKAKEGASFAQLLKGLHTGVYVASALIVLAVAGLMYYLFGSDMKSIVDAAGVFQWWGLVAAVGLGLASGLVIAYATEYYTSYEHPPTKRIAQQAITGPATVIIGGIAEGMKSTWAALLTVVVAIIGAFTLAGGADNFLIGLYGVAIAAVGMLSTLGITLATDAYGPIADNAGGNAEMTQQPAVVRERTDMLDSLGNTTAATGKGFAIGSAALTALALFAAFIQVVQLQNTDLAENYVAKSAAVAPAGDNPYAIYMGDRRFAIVAPDAEGEQIVDAGLVIDRIQLLGTSFGDVKKGTVFATVRPQPRLGQDQTSLPSVENSRRFQIQGAAADGGRPMLLNVIGTRNGSMGDVASFYDITLTNPRVLGGLFIGVLLTFLFCAMTMSAVGRAAYSMMGECRRQFGLIREALRKGGMSETDVANPDNWPMDGVDLDGHHYPDYANCVAISTAGAQKEMVIPSALAISVPIVVGLVLSVPGVVGMLAGGLTSGFAVAIFMANAGGAWDNAKKLLESYGKITADDLVKGNEAGSKVPAEIRDELMPRAKEMIAAGNPDGIIYGKGSEDHKATVVGDTVGDPFKDTSGPALNILIKLISIVSVVFAGLTVAYGSKIGSMIGLN